jgi:hypothetical protein
MTLYRWAKQLLVRSKYGNKLAASAKCCCTKWYCVLTSGKSYECRDSAPDPNTGDQLLSEHSNEQECNKECYERYFCVTNPDGTKECAKEGDVNNRPADGPYKKSECQAKCSCPHCGNEACEQEATGNDALVVCCGRAEEIWEFKGGQWEIVAPCGNDPDSMCTGVPPAFPDSPNEGDRVSINCEGGFKDPPSGELCPKCKYGCVEDSSTGEKRCEREPDSGQYLTEKECKPDCEGLWFCTASDKCEKLAEPPEPGKEGYATEQECLDTAPDKCPPKKWRCNAPDACIEEIEQQKGRYYDTKDECEQKADFDCPLPCDGWPPNSITGDPLSGNYTSVRYLFDYPPGSIPDPQPGDPPPPVAPRRWRTTTTVTTNRRDLVAGQCGIETTVVEKTVLLECKGSEINEVDYAPFVPERADWDINDPCWTGASVLDRKQETHQNFDGFGQNGEEYFGPTECGLCP